MHADWLVRVVSLLHLAALATTGWAQNAAPAASDWATTGWDCTLFAAADIDADGFDDLVTVNGNRHLCVAYTVHGWKSAPWEVLAESIPAEAIDLHGGDLLPEIPGDEVAILMPDHLAIHSQYAGGRLTQNSRIEPPENIALRIVRNPRGLTIREADGARSWTLTNGVWSMIDTATQDAPPPSNVLAIDPPPFEPAAPLLFTFQGDFNADSILDTLAAFSATKPHQHRVVRLALAPNPASADQDSDGLTDEEERAIGSRPLDRDTDDDGLLDGWEVKGLPRNISIGDKMNLSPLRQDVIVAVARYEPLEHAVVEAEVKHAAEPYRKLPNMNPDGATGIWIHPRFDPPVPVDQQRTWSWWDIGNERFPARERGFMHWMQVTPGGGGQAQQTGDMGGSGCNWAAFAHEFGHQLSLSHEGDSAPAWCPLYPSLMNYAFSYSLGGDGNAIRFSDGRFATVSLEESKLVERLPFTYADLKYLEAPPFRFPLKEDGANATLVDWNQNGKFDEGTVSADINYGGSTNGGIRRNHDLIGAAPALCYVGDTCFLITLDQTQSAVSIKTYLGNEQWTDRRPVPNSATNTEPVALGLTDHGLVFIRKAIGWHISRFTKDLATEPVAIPASKLPACDLSAALINGRVLLVSRHDDDRLEYRWLDENQSPEVTEPIAMELRSQTPVGIAQDPVSKRLVIATSMTNSQGSPLCLRVTWLSATNGGNGAPQKLIEQETIWTRGEASGNNSTTRPVVSFTDQGELYIFHTGMPAPNGLMTAWRTRRIANQALDEGWLTCMMYDIWTLTRVGVAFANGPAPGGAIYAYRWDAGEYGETHVNHLQTAHNGLGIDAEPMRDHNDSAKISLWGIRHSILNIRREP